MDERSGMLDIFTITGEGLRVGVDSAEIERVASDVSSLGGDRSPDRAYRLEELLPGGRANGGAAGARVSALVLKSEDGRNGLVTFDGVMDVMSIPIPRIMPVPDFVRRAQKPLFVWGFYAAAGGLIALVTFHYLVMEGAA